MKNITLMSRSDVEAHDRALDEAHEAHKARLAAVEANRQEMIVYQGERYDGDVPKELEPGVVIMPGDYYVQVPGTDQHFVLQAVEVETYQQYAEKNQQHPHWIIQESQGPTENVTRKPA